MYRRYGKRLLDVVVTTPALIALTPLLAFVVLLVHLDSPGPIFFLQERLGWGGRTFKVYKFRTMQDRPRRHHREIIGREAEVTRVGYWLRRTKVDEMPQLLNVLRGEMSLVGPRPALPSDLEKYDFTARQRLTVAPGLTGLAQVHGNIHLSWPERWHYDVVYVRRLSFRLDLWILVRTVAVVLFGEDRWIKSPDVFGGQGEL